MSAANLIFYVALQFCHQADLFSRHFGLVYLFLFILIEIIIYISDALPDYFGQRVPIHLHFSSQITSTFQSHCWCSVSKR